MMFTSLESSSMIFSALASSCTLHRTRASAAYPRNLLSIIVVYPLMIPACSILRILSLTVDSERLRMLAISE